MTVAGNLIMKTPLNVCMFIFHQLNEIFIHPTELTMASNAAPVSPYRLIDRFQIPRRRRRRSFNRLRCAEAAPLPDSAV